MKLSDLKPEDVEYVNAPPAKLKLSDLDPADIEYGDAPAEPSFGEQAKSYFEDAVVDQLPAIGAAGGGLVGGAGGSVIPGAGTVGGGLVGAGLGGYAGKVLQDTYNTAFRPEKAPKDFIEPVTGALQAGAEGVALEGAGQIIAKPVIAGAKYIGSKIPSGNKVMDYIRERAEKNATRALGRPTPTEAKKMAKSGEDRAIGRTLLDKGAIPWLGTHGRIANRVEALKESAWAPIQAMLNSGGDDAVVDGTEAGMKILNSPELQAFRDAGESAYVNAYEAVAEQMAGMGKLTLQKAQEIKKTLDKLINYNKANIAAGAEQSGRVAKRTAVRDSMNEAVEKLGSGKDALKKEFKEYGKLEKADDILDREIGRDQANRVVSGTDTIMTGVGLLNGGPVPAVALGALNKFGRTFKNSLSARGLDATANAMGKFGPAIKAAAARGENALNSTMSILSKNPEFLQMLKELEAGLAGAIPQVAENEEGKSKRGVAGK